MLGGLIQTGVTDEALAAKYVVQQDPVTEVFQVAGVDIPPAIPIAWTDFILLDWTQLGGLFYLVIDVHSVGSTGGSLWMADAAGNRPVLKDGPLQYATLALAPDPTLYPGLRILPADVGHVCKSDGTRYRIEATSAMISNTLADIPHGGTFTTEVLLKSIQIPVDVNNNSILADGDVLIIYEAYCQKTGVANIMTRRYLLGTSVTVGDYTNAATGVVLGAAESAGTAIGRSDKLMRIRRLNATTVRIDGGVAITGNYSVGGPQTVARNVTQTTTTSFDSATPPSLHYGLKLDGVSDTDLMLLSGYRVGIERGY